MAIIMLGPPGAGKGTQARLISETFGFAHISTGDMLRTAIKEGTELGARAKTLLEAGLLVPDELVDAIVRERLQKPDCGRGFILDGYPRTLAQAGTLQGILDRDGVISVTVGIKVPDQVLIGRLGARWVCPNCNRTFSEQLSSGKIKGLCDRCGVTLMHRADDTEEVVTSRLKVYHEQTEPLIRYYQEQEIFVPIDGDELPAKVFYAIRDVVDEKMNSAPAKKT